METLAIEGPTPLRGEIEVAGAKNSVSKLLTASMLTEFFQRACYR